MNDVCNLYIEELVESGCPKIGGICPECNKKVSMHQRMAPITTQATFATNNHFSKNDDHKIPEHKPVVAKSSNGTSSNAENKKNLEGKTVIADKPQKTNRDSAASKLDIEKNQHPRGTLSNTKVREIPVDPPLSPVPPNNSEVYMEDSIREKDKRRFAAAGILMYKFVKGTLRVLLGIEYRIGEYGMVLNMLGGKKNSGENPKETAIREFWEESGKLCSKRDIQDAVMSGSTTNIWFGPGLYVVHLVICPQSMTDIDERYNALKRRDASAEMEKLMWVRWDDVVNAASSTDQPEVVVRVWRQNFTYRLSEFLIRLLRNDVVVNALHRPDVIHQVIADLAETVNREHQLTKSVKVPAQSKDWQLKIKLPTAAPVVKPSIVTLQTKDKDYPGVFGSVPDTLKPRVVSIRKVEVAHCIAAHKEEERRLGSEVIQVINATFHGTPDTWRATSIAFKGFDLNLKLNGRACGDGVYSSTDINVANGYTRNSGSIIQLRGLLTQKDFNQSPIIVFRGAKQVLPQYIIDFATVSGDDSADGDGVEAQKRKLAEAEENKRQELLKEAAAIREKEAAFKDRSEKMFLAAHAYYASVVNDIKEKTGALLKELAGPDKDSDVLMRRAATLNRRFETERKQFRASLPGSLLVNPIYVEKSRLLEAIKVNDVVIVSAATGSGKSTQLPQYIVDDVFDSSDMRRVAVLEPRRFNAIGLCSRVSSERGENMGMEVGYSLGQGDVCTSEATRIEFMTHGLFINYAVSPQKLVAKYGAVILDEAHERSVDVDLCFALLRRTLEYVANTGGISFKVIVASATLSADQLQRYKDFLLPSHLPSALKGTIFSVGGSSFPVQIMYRSEAEPNWEEANSMETAAALASYATEIAMNLIKSSDSDGNILIFMPGESVIDNCIASLTNWSVFKPGGGVDDTSVTSTGDVHEIQLKVKRGSIDSIVRIGLYAFHGKVSEALRRKMETHAGQDRIVIFSTNVAETGLTLPNIRYVIDTGLERRVIWNKETCMQEMRTVRITASSMNQRTGRAGRVASGICVRLYSKETADQMGDKGPEIESGMILKAVLLKQRLQKDGKGNGNGSGDTNPGFGNTLTMLEDIPEDGLRNAQDILYNLGAMDENKTLTDVGEKLLTLGLELRLGRFLLACHSNGCLGSGTDLAAIVSTTNCISLLPRRSADGKSDYSGASLIDSSGDHLTLKNIFTAYERSHSKTSFCSTHDFDATTLEAAGRAREHIANTLLRMQLVDDDADEVKTDKALCKTRLLVSLCSAYFDHILTANTPGKPAGGFVRVQSVDDRNKQRLAAINVAAFGGVKRDDTDDDTIDSDDTNSTISSLTMDSQDDDTGSDQKENKSSFNGYDKVNVSKSCSLWEIPERDNSSSVQQLAVFNSIMLTDSMRGPVAQLISYVQESHVREGASDWYENSNVGTLIANLGITKQEFKISQALARYLVRKNVLKGFFNKFLRVNATVDKSRNVLVVSAPSFALRHVERKLERLESENVDEETKIVINNLSRNKTNQLVNFFGRGETTGAQQKQEFVDRLNRMILNGLGGHEQFVEIHAADLGIHKDTPAAGSCTVTVRLQGPAKQFSSSVIGVVQSTVSEQLDSIVEIHYNSLTNTQIGTLVNNLGKELENKKRFVKTLNDTLRQKGSNKEFLSTSVGVQSDKTNPSACMVFAKVIDHLRFSPIIVDAIKTEINRIFAVSATGSVVAASTVVSPPNIQLDGGSKINKYLTQISSRAPPIASNINDLNDEMIFMAHVAVWTGKCSVYGGFIRDLLLNNAEPNDIDVGYEPRQTNVNSLKGILVQAATSMNIRVVQENPSKGMAYAIKFQGRGKAFDIDLVNMEGVRAMSNPPGVDCDVGNMAIDVSGQDNFGLRLKVKDKQSLLSLAVSQKHCREKKFVFYYRMDSPNATARLDKYFKHGWVCLTQLGEPALSWAMNKGYAHLLQPKAEFSIPFYQLP